jgi:hypothetical protein
MDWLCRLCSQRLYLGTPQYMKCNGIPKIGKMIFSIIFHVLTILTMRKYIKISLQIVAICMAFTACSPLFHVKKKLLICPQISNSVVNTDSLTEQFGSHKTFLPQIKSAALIALSRFPELKNTRIEFLYKNIKTTMETRPKINLKAFTKHRTYQVLINLNQGKSKALDIDSLSESVKIGWIAHELGHIVDYENRTAFSILAMGMYYVTVPSFKKNIEQSVDIIAIRHGFGRELCAGVEHLLYHSNATEKYKKNSLKYYLPLETMKLEINKCNE